MTRKKGKQIMMWNNGEELPIFTGTPIPVQEQRFDPTPQPDQLALFRADWTELANEKQTEEARQRRLKNFVTRKSTTKDTT